jgi:cytidine deaminase
LNDRDLIEEAAKAREHAYAPYSGVRIGASVETTTGEVFSGCNVENSSYGLTVCAERVAIFAAVCRGHTGVKKVAIVAEGLENPMPCGACREVMSEFGVEKVLVGKPDGTYEIYDFDSLLPHRFRL